MLNMEATTNRVGKKRFADFSIESLLKKDYKSTRGTLGHSNNSDQSENVNETRMEMNLSEYPESLVSNGILEGNADNCNSAKTSTFSWLSCTRFKPPKLTRSRRKSSSKRNGRGPRIPFSTHQLNILEATFKNSQYLSSKAITKLAQNLQLTEIRVKIWFQNRRARFRRESGGSATATSTCHQSSTISSHLEGDLMESSCSSSLQLYNISSISSSFNKHTFRHFINDLNLMTATNLGNYSSCFTNLLK